MKFLHKIHDFIKTLSKGEDIQFFKNIEFKESLGTIEISSVNKTLIYKNDQEEGSVFKRANKKLTKVLYPSYCKLS
ncbi:hypothetical protein CL657_05980 [bacterium]|nr:hypothetical protein [bacterium]|tara:strand:+ start:254 stop:481 length:228 start_codon:yes stop_codon:yes gene_type:complete